MEPAPYRAVVPVKTGELSWSRPAPFWHVIVGLILCVGTTFGIASFTSHWELTCPDAGRCSGADYSTVAWICSAFGCSLQEPQMYNIERNGDGIPPLRGEDKMGPPFFRSALTQLAGTSGKRSDTAWSLIGLTLVQLVGTGLLVIAVARRVQFEAKTDGAHLHLKIHGRNVVQLHIPVHDVVAFELRTQPGDPGSPYAVLVTRESPPYDLFSNDVGVPRRQRAAAIRALERWRQQVLVSS